MYQPIMLLALAFFSFFFKTSCYSASTPTPTPYFTISDNSNYYQDSGVFSYTSNQEPQIYVESHGFQGDLTVDVYQSNLDAMLKFLVHDDKNNQINTKVDYSKFNLIKQFNTSIVNNENKNITLPLPESGIFFVIFRSSTQSQSAFIVRSTIGSLATESKDTLVVWTQDYKTKRSVSSGKVTLYSLKNQITQIDTGNFDGQGVASVSTNQQPDVAIVESNNSFALVPLNLTYLNSPNYYTSFSQNKPSQKFYIFTDRPLYQPGDTVNFKVIARQDDDARYSATFGTADITVTGSKLIYKNTYNIDSNGIFGGSFVIPKNSKTGYYDIFVNKRIINDPDFGEYSTEDESISFQVETYRKPEYFLTASSKQTNIVRGNQASFDISGSYYSGQPLSNATVDYVIRSSELYSGYFYSNHQYDYYPGWWGEEIDSGSVTLDKKGKASIKIDTDKNDFKGKDQMFFVEFTYQDASGNPATTGASVYVNAGEYSLYTDNDFRYYGKINEIYKLPLVVKSNTNSSNLKQKVELEITRKWWEKIIDEGKKYPRYQEHSEVVMNKTVYTDDQGKTVFEYTPKSEGNYNIVAKITDKKNNLISKNFNTWIGNLGFNQSQEQQPTLTFSADKELYQPSDIAKITIKSTVSNRDVYLSINRGYQDRYQVIHLEGDETTIDLPIKPQDLPNFYLSVSSFDDDNLVRESKNISVNPDTRKIHYQLTTDKKDYGPGDEVTVDVTAYDNANNPIETNLALWAVDKSIYALADDNKKDINEVFWGERYNNTSFSHSLVGIHGANGAEKGGCFLADTQILMADGSQKNIDQIKVGDYVQANPKSKGKVTAVHQAKTDGYYIINGDLKVTANHLLFINQRWQTARVAQIGDQLLGSNGQAVTINSLEYLSLPDSVYNFTVEKYHTYFADGIQVHNDKGSDTRTAFADTAYWNMSINTNSSGKAQVKFRLPDNLTTWVIAALGASSDTKVGQNTTEIKTSKNLVIRPALPNIVNRGDEIVVSAIVNNFSQNNIYSQISFSTDAGKIESPTLINQKVPANDFVLASWKIKVDSTKPKANFEFKVKDNSGNNDGIVQVLNVNTVGYYQNYSEFNTNLSQFKFQNPANFDKTKSTSSLYLSSNLLGSLPSAIKYLVEYPYGCVEQTTSALVSRLIGKKYFSIGSTDIDKGLEKLEQMQSSDGGWSWWNSTQSDDFITAYVFRVLSIAKSMGYKVDDDMYQKALNNLSQNFDSSSLSVKVAKAYGLSFSSDSKNYQSVTNNLNELDSNLLAMAVIANKKFGIEDENLNGTSLLLAKVISTENQVYWPVNDTKYYSEVSGNTALAIQALSLSNNYQDIINKAANYLSANRLYDYWGNSYSTAQVLMAVTNLKSTDNLVSYQLKSGDKVISSGALDKIKNSIEIPVDFTKIDASKPLTLTKTGGDIYSTFNQKYWISSNQSSAVSHQVTISKEYRNHLGVENNFIPGDLVDVILNINFDNLNLEQNYARAVIEDHLPSGLIPVNSHLNNQSKNSSWENYGYEYLPDGVIIPLYLNNKSNFTVTYQARVINSGKFTSPSTYFNLMYSPEVWARSSSYEIIVDNDRKIDLSKKASSSSFKIEKQIPNFLIFIVLVVGLVLVFKYVKKKPNN
ncbi:MAG TPA: alpha-2-macroglobulin family protein [Candidatus Woesebacteria bacterium]|nr:alpha-2-macroglobulin family protein [Candidatus Woesebacteria bacterium]